MDSSRRDTTRAERLSREAADLIGSDPVRAESLLREALGADLYYGPAHNNLGVVYLNAGRLYEAAAEFEWARKLMPGHPGPRLNLGLAFQHGGRINEAIEAYRSAVVVVPEHIGSIQALESCKIRHNLVDAETLPNLRLLAERGSPQTRAWSRDQILRLEWDSREGL